MKISYDLDGTLFAYPTELLNFAWLMQKCGNEVGILTGRNLEDINNNVLPLLKQHGFTPDFFIGRDFEPTETDWDANIKNQVWKPQMIKEHNIDIHFDDQCEGSIGEDNGGAKIIKV